MCLHLLSGTELSAVLGVTLQLINFATMLCAPVASLQSSKGKGQLYDLIGKKCAALHVQGVDRSRVGGEAYLLLGAVDEVDITVQ